MAQIGAKLVPVVIQFAVTLAIPCAIVYLFIRRNRERDANAPLRDEVAAGGSFAFGWPAPAFSAAADSAARGASGFPCAVRSG